VNIVEAIGVRWAILMGKNLSLKKVIIEGDSRICFNAINSDRKGYEASTTPWEIITVIEDLVELSMELEFVDFEWIYIEANEAAQV
jgi:ribonuclease HI